ncbi:PAS domain-containing protein [Sulfuriferula sp. GW1]|uniref:PAS domain-containing protein n=1 Tax=Sulfuriferula sp. GW1 TaxID=3345111 RepID=UPI0039AFE7C1
MNNAYSLPDNEFGGSEIGLLCLDYELRVLWFTQTTQNIFGLPDSIHGRSLSEISENLVASNLMEDARIVANTRLPLQRNFTMPNGRSFLRRIMPYKGKSDISSGMVILFIEIAKNRYTENMAINTWQVTESLKRHKQERIVELQTLAMRMTLAEEHERYNLAHEIHNDLGGILAATKLKLRACQQERSSPLFKQRAAELDSLLTQAYGSVHSMIFQLCPPLLHEIGLMPALEWLAEDLHRTSDLKIVVQHDSMDIPLDLPVATLVFRAVREILANVAALARVSRIVLSARCQDNRLQIILGDSGSGFDYREALTQPGGFALSSIEERLNYLYGGIEVEDMPRNGTRLILSAPLAGASAYISQEFRP